MKKLLLSVVAIAAVATVSAQRVALNSNLLSLGVGSLNLGSEIRLSSHWTLASDITFNVTNFWGDVPYGEAALNDFTEQDDIEGFYTNGWSGFVEARYYFSKAFKGFHLGLYAMGGRYGKAQGDDGIITLLTIGGFKESGINAYITSAGLSLGYRFRMGQHWGLDLYVGGGVLYSEYTPGLFREQNDGREGRKDVLSWTLMKSGLALSYTF